MKVIMAGCITLVGLALFASQWITPGRPAQPKAEFDVLREYNKRVAIPARDIREIPEPVFNELMGRSLRQITDDLAESRASINQEGLMGVCGGAILGIGVWWLAREAQKRKGVQRRLPAPVES